MKRRLLTVLLIVITTISYAQQKIDIVPKPNNMEILKGTQRLFNCQSIVYNKGLNREAELLRDYLQEATGYTFILREGSKALKNGIYLGFDKSVTAPEGYNLSSIQTDGIIIEAGTEAGIFNGIQTLLQLLPPNIMSDKISHNISWTIPAVKISDKPQYEWRGMMLDVSRYFMSKDYVMKYIDLMSMYKLNVLHLHLVDDSGWRIEIPKYPLLTKIGAFRGEGEKRTGGFYSKQDISDIVEYAAARNVEIIPEVEFPAHILSAVVAYPWLSCRGEQLKVPEQHYISKDLICVGKDSSLIFLQDVIDEIAAQFPSKYIHVGGDEAVYDYWDKCPRCSAVKKEQGFEKSSELQSYLTNKVAEMAAKHGKTLVGWEEIVQRGKVDKQVVSMIWRDVKEADEAIKLGHKAVFAPADYTYFDFPESNFPGEVKAAMWKGPISIEKCYGFDISKYEGNSSMVGVHGCLWTDQFIHGTILQEIEAIDENRSENYVNYFTLPRLLVLSEIGWTQGANRDLKDFEDRLSRQYKRLDFAGFNYRVPTPKVVSTKASGDGFMVSLAPAVEGSVICYTTDGSKPSPYSDIYENSVYVAQLSDLRAITVLSAQKFSIPLFFHDNYDQYKSYGAFVYKFQHSTLKIGKSVVTVDLTGKLTSDGKFDLSLLPLTPNVNVTIGDIEIYKHNEKIASSTGSNKLTDATVTRSVNIKGWQAGTPFSAKITIDVSDSNKGNFGLFLKK